MLPRARLGLPLLLLFASFAIAKDKDPVLPDIVLKARTVLVIVDPNSGIPVTDPLGNRTAQADAEKALMRWGRFVPVIAPMDADLIIVVRKGSGKTVTPTIGGTPGSTGSSRPVIIQPTGGDTRIGVQHGGGIDAPAGPMTGPRPTTEVGPADDMFVVYLGSQPLDSIRPLSGPAVWRYIKKNALRSPDVPAVDEFRKLIEKALKQQNGKP